MGTLIFFFPYRMAFLLSIIKKYLVESLCKIINIKIPFDQTIQPIMWVIYLKNLIGKDFLNK